MRNHPAKKTGSKTNSQHLLPGESPDAYNAVRSSWEAEYPAGTPGIEPLLTKLIDADRQLRLATAAVFKAQTALYNDDNASDELTAKLHQNYQRLLDYQTQHDRTFERALRNIEQFAARRFREDLAIRRQEGAEYKTAIELGLRCHEHKVKPEELLPTHKRTNSQPVEISSSLKNVPKPTRTDFEVTEVPEL